MLQIRGIMAKSFGDRFFFFPSDELLHFWIFDGQFCLNVSFNDGTIPNFNIEMGMVR